MDQKQNLKVIPEVKTKAERETNRKLPDPNDEKAWMLFIDEIEPEHPQVAEDLSNPANLYTEDIHPAEKEYAAANRRHWLMQTRDRIFNRDDAQGERAPAKQRWVFYLLGLYVLGALAFTGYRGFSQPGDEEIVDPQFVAAPNAPAVTATPPDARPMPVPRVDVGRREPQLSGPQAQATTAQSQRPQPSSGAGEGYDASANTAAELEEIPQSLLTQYAPPVPPAELYVGGRVNDAPPPPLQVADGVSAPDPSLSLYVGEAGNAASTNLPGLVVGDAAFGAGTAAATSLDNEGAVSRTIADTRPMPQAAQGQLMPGLESLREPLVQQPQPEAQPSTQQLAARQNTPLQGEPATAAQVAQAQSIDIQPDPTPIGIKLNFQAGTKIQAELETGIALLPGAVLPVVAVSAGDWCTEPPCPTIRWIGRAQLDGNPSVQVVFDTLIIEGETRPATAMILDPVTHTAGLEPRLVDDTPAATQDLIRALAGGASNYADALSQETTVSVIDGVAVTERTTPGLENFLLGSAAALFATEQDQTAIVRSARVEKGSSAVILYGVSP